MATGINALDSTSSDSFEVSDNITEAASESREELVEEPAQDMAKEGGSWYDEEDGQEHLDVPAPENSEDDSSTEEVSAEQAEDADSTDGETSPQRMSIDVRRKNHEFNLDPNDETLRRTLRNGVRAQDIKADNDKLTAEMTELRTSVEDANEAQSVFQELTNLASEGDYDQIVKAVLGAKYQEYLETKIDDYMGYQNATPEERATMDAQRAAKQASYAERVKDKKIKELESRLESKASGAEEQKLHGYATASLRANAISADEIADADIRSRMNKRLWSSSWDAIKTLSKTREITPKLIEAVFKKESKLSRYGVSAATSSSIQEAVAKKKEVAATTAGNIATSNHPQSGKGPNLDGWNGKSAKDLLKFFK